MEAAAESDCKKAEKWRYPVIFVEIRSLDRQERLQKMH
jgi:hypothetical protein